MAPGTGNADGRVLVWDWPVRAFHWALAGSFAGAWWFAGDSRYTHLHVFFGYLALGLVLFRLVWGWTGTRHARFAAFAATPAEALAYARDVWRGRAAHTVTHNPVGSWAVWLLLGLAALLGATGLLALGGQEQQGPLAGLLARADGWRIAQWHGWIAWAGVALIAVHVTGVLLESRVHHENLVRGMIDGRKPGHAGDAIAHARGGVALLLLASTLAFAFWYFHDALSATAEKPWLPYTSPALPANADWDAECGSCHLAFHPSLLPARSWDAMLAQQADHFGEDLMLDEPVAARLRAWARSQSAEHGRSEAAMRIAASLPAGASPQRITETPYWKAQHADIPAQAWDTQSVHGKPDCAACHRDAEAATFEDGAMRVPPP